MIDGDTLVVAFRHVRIWGIDAPEHDQRCGRSDGAQWACGEFSRDAYAGQEAEARASLNGIWSGTFENPWDWRHAHSGQEAAR